MNQNRELGKGVGGEGMGEGRWWGWGGRRSDRKRTLHYIAVGQL
jgi:hypothetical protein